MRAHVICALSEERAVALIQAVMDLRVEVAARELSAARTWREVIALVRCVAPALRAIFACFGVDATARLDKFLETIYDVCLTDPKRQPPLGPFVGGFLVLILRKMGTAFRAFREEAVKPCFQDIFDGESGVHHLTLVHLLHTAEMRHLREGAQEGGGGDERQRRRRRPNRGGRDESGQRAEGRTWSPRAARGGEARRDERPRERPQERPQERNWRTGAPSVRPRPLPPSVTAESRAPSSPGHRRPSPPPHLDRSEPLLAGASPAGSLEAPSPPAKEGAEGAGERKEGNDGSARERPRGAGSSPRSEGAHELAAPLGCIPNAWGEADAAARWDEACTAELPFLSRRRALEERPEVLLIEPLNTPVSPPHTSPVRTDAPPAAPAFATAPRFEQLLLPEARQRISEWLDQARACLTGAGSARAPASLILTEEQSLVPQARGQIWDCRDPLRCAPVVPSTAAKPPPSAIDGAFVAAVAEALAWPDKEMVRQVREGVDDGAAMPPLIALHFHHRGLRNNKSAARKAVDEERQGGMISRGYDHLPFLPCVLTPHNVVTQTKWRLDETAELLAHQKHRVTTDDSWTAFGLAPSRNGQMQQADWPELLLPTARDAARAAAILRIGSQHADHPTPVKVILRDLTAAYRQLGVQTARLWLQAFIWDDGVTVDERLNFGTAYNVQFFQRFSSFLLAEAGRRADAWDAQHPPRDRGLLRWLTARRNAGVDTSLAYRQVYIDDACVVVLDDRGPGFEDGRAQAHFQILEDVFEGAGFTISRAKDQIGEASLVLGYLISTPRNRIAFPQEKQAILRARLARALARANVAYRELESLAGTLCHLCTVLPEGKQRLHPLYAMLGGFQRTPHARPQAGGNSWRRAHPSALAIGGKGLVATEARKALRWFWALTARPIECPLAPRLRFPSPASEAEAVFLYVDASREWGLGGWTITSQSATKRQPATIHFFALRYPPILATRIAAGESSTGAIELAAAAVGHQTLVPNASAVACFTDSEAARGAINSGASGAASMRAILDNLFGGGAAQWLACRVTTTENERADKASRGEVEAAARQAKAAGFATVLHPVPRTIAHRAMAALEAGMDPQDGNSPHTPQLPPWSRRCPQPATPRGKPRLGKGCRWARRRRQRGRNCFNHQDGPHALRCLPAGHAATDGSTSTRLPR